LGSFFAGIKAGTLSGIIYVGGMAIFNVMILYALKPDVLNLISTSYGSICGAAATNSTANIESCFDSVVAVDVPYIAFVAFFVALIFAGLFGRYYDSFPGGSRTLRGEAVAALVGASLVLFGFSGFYFDSTAAAATTVFLIAWTVVFGYLLGKLYKKYTRVVEITSEDPELLKVLVDNADMTGKSKTFAATSNHKLRAEVSDDASFKGWAASGGVTLEDPKSFETVMEINGDGSIDGKVGKKY
jgi:hypothetical protein